MKVLLLEIVDLKSYKGLILNATEFQNVDKFFYNLQSFLESAKLCI